MEEDVIRDGGGSGGGSQDPGDQTQSVNGGWKIQANQIDLLCRPPLPPAIEGDCIISIAAANVMTMGGRVNVRGLAGVRITAGPPPLPETNSNSTQGVEIEVGEIQNVTIKRGLIDGVDQKIEMTPTGITVDGGAMPITIQSLTKITLSVAGGLSSIELSPEGITIQGMPLVTIQGALVKIN